MAGQCHGRAWLPMTSPGRPWPPMAKHSRPLSWPGIGAHDIPWLAMATRIYTQALMICTVLCTNWSSCLSVSGWHMHPLPHSVPVVKISTTLCTKSSCLQKEREPNTSSTSFRVLVSRVLPKSSVQKCPRNTFNSETPPQAAFKVPMRQPAKRTNCTLLTT